MLNENGIVVQGELSDAQLDAVIGGGVWGWVKDKAKKVGGLVVRGTVAAIKWLAEHPEVIRTDTPKR